MKPVSLIVAGAGNRGNAYSSYALRHPDLAEVVAVAEPRDVYRERFAGQHGISSGNTLTDWRSLADRERFADAVIIATQDAMHREPAEAFAAKGYHVLLEKPMAPDEESCRAIVAAAKAGSGLFAVCHVLRYTAYTRKIKELIDGGAVGEVVSLQRLEPVGFWHQAHSFVRGNWRREDESSFMLLAKSCHDLDWIRYVVGNRCRHVSSFGNLKHFRASAKPAGATDRCVDCPVEPRCPYSAVRIYLGRVDQGNTGWPVSVLAAEVDRDSISDALRTGPYGRCVYGCDNDVVDHQVVSMLFEEGQTAAFTMTAFTKTRPRHTSIFGTHGEITGDGRMLDLYDFLTDRHTTIDTAAGDDSGGGHGGGDYYLMKSFVEALRTGDASHILSGPDETLESHLMVFAAERARREGTVVEVR
jgi:predicted dehydrogenase